MFKFNPYYDQKVILRTVATILAVFGAMKLTGGAAFALVIPMALYAMFMNRVDSMLFWIVLTNMLVVTTDYFVPKGFIFAAGFRFLLTIMGGYGIMQFFSVRSSRLVAPLMGLFIYLLYMIIPSLQGWAPKVACMKLVLFCATYMALAYISTKAQASSTVDIRKLRSIMLAFAIVYLVGSVLVVPFPGISLLNAEELLRTGSVSTSLFKGMTNHSQTMGVLICCFMTFLLGDLFFSIQKPDRLYLVLAACGLFLIGKTSSRTAMGSLLVAVTFLSYNMMQSRGINQRWKSRVVSTVMIVFVLIIGVLVAVPSARQQVMRKAMKWGVDDGKVEFSLEGATMSRMGLVEESLYYFRMKPAIGWGFQVSPEVGYKEKHSDGLILSAPVEKGVWVTAILEEGGVFGELIYVIYALTAFFILMTNRAYMSSTIFLLIHVSNLGEFTMFSMSSVGCVWYVVLFVSLIFDAKRLQQPKPMWNTFVPQAQRI